MTTDKISTVLSAAAGITFNDGILEYQVLTNNPNTVTVTGWADAPQQTLTIPATVSDGTTTYIVTEIANSAFQWDITLTTLNLPQEGSLVIGESAFYGSGISGTLTISKSVTSIGVSAFQGTAINKLELPQEGNLIIGASAFRNTGISGTLTIPSSVIFIGNSAFGNTAINKLELPQEGNLVIGDSAFYGLGISGTLTIPNSVTSIGASAFKYTSISGTLTIPNSVTSIGASAFDSTGISGTLIIPSSVTSIGVSAFQGTAINKLELPPEGNLVIGNSAFKYTSISGTLIIPSSVTSIGASAFEGTGISGTLTIPNSVTSIGASAFYGTKISGTLTISKSVTSIGASAFQGTAINKLELPPEGNLVIGDSAFYGLGISGTLTIPNSVTSIGASAFYGTKISGTLTISKSVTSIGASAFQGTGINKLELPQEGNLAIGDSAFNGLGISGTLIIPSSVTSIGASAFRDTHISGTLTIPNSVTFIGDAAFYGTKISGTLTIPSSVTSIGVSAFQGTAINKLELPQEGNLAIGASAFYGTKISGTLTIPSSVTSIGASAFQGTKITSLILPQDGKLELIGKSAFKDLTTLTGTLAIPKSVTSIGTYAFEGTGINKLELPQDGKLELIGDSAFMDLTTLTGTLAIPKSVTSIGNYAFQGTAINKLELPQEGNLVIGGYAFYGTKISGTLTISDGVTSIGASAFVGTSISGTLTISKSVTSIGASAFGNTAINKLELPPEGNLVIGASAFGNTGISGTLTIPSSVTSIGEFAFQYTGISGTLTIPSSVTSIGSSAFQGCTMLTAVDLSAYSGELTPMVFWGCTSLSQITLSYSEAPETQNNVFAGCAAQGTIYYPAGATGYTKEAFMKGGFSEWTFTAYTAFNVTVSPAENGTAAASHITARPGTIVNLSVQHIDRGYIFSGWNVRHNAVTWTDDTDASSPIARFIMPGNDVTIIPTFTKTVITPNAPQDLQVVKGVRQVTLSWNAPLDNNALPLTAYHVRVDNGNWINIDSSKLSYTFTNLTSAPHTFEVRAVNEEAQGTPASLQASPLGNGDTVTLLQAISNGEEDIVTTTAIWLIFDQSVDGLTADDISLGDNPGFTINSLTGSGRDWKLSLAGVKQPTVVTLQLPGLTAHNIKVNYETSEIPIHYHYPYYIKNVILLSHVLSTQLFVGEPQTVGRLWVWDVSPEIQNSLSYQWYICKPGEEFELVADASGNFFTYHAEWPAGTYQLQVIVSAAGAKSVTSNVLEFTILEKTYGFSINYNNPQGTYPFPNCPQGYTETETKKVKITSTGTVKITPNDITVSLSDSADEYFEVSAVRYDPESSGNCFFTITPRLGLSAGNYSATVKVSGSEPHGEEYSFSVSFVVWPPPQYNIDVQSGEGGTASANKESAPEGETITLTAVPEKTHVFKEWQISSGDFTLSDPTNPTVTFTMPAESVTIKAVFDALPTGTITLADHVWNDLPEAIDFNLFFKSEQTVTITASDDSKEAVTIAYHLHYGDTALTVEDLKTITWNSYGAAFSIVQEDKLIIYAKLTDNVGNTTYLSSEGIVLDQTPPLLEGAENNQTYNAALTITVSDDHLQSVLLNEKEQLSPNDNTSKEITLSDNGKYVIKATDKAGNETTITVTIAICNLTAIEDPNAITNVANGTKLTEIVLPESVNIQTTVGQKQAAVDWDLSTAKPAYDPSKEDQQTFIITGTITLPGGVTNHESLPLTVEISITVEAKAEASLSAIEIITNPAKLEYIVGEALDLTGLQVKLSYDNDTHETVDFANFSEKGITTSLAQGTVLTLADKSVIVYAGGKSANFTIAVSEAPQNQVATPVFTPSSGTYDGKQKVAITCATDDATIYYTIDGTEPTTNNTTYADVIIVEKNTIIKAIAVKEGMTNSAIATASYTINYQITATAGEGGNISPAGKVTVESGKTQTFTITANNGYNIKDVKVDGISVGKVNSYEFENVTKNHQIAVEFEKDITPPTGKITIGNENWPTLLDELTFSLFFKDAQDVTITAEDDSGKAVTIQYHLGDKALTKDELNALEASQWKKYDTNFSIQPDDKLVIYAKLTDHAENVNYLSSNGIVLDRAAPTFSIAGGTYTKAQTITVSDNYALASVLLNNVEQLPASNSITLDANGTYVIKATDKAGNEAAITVTIKLPNLTKIESLEAIEVANGTPLEEINLPEQVTITTTDGNKQVDVIWDLENVNGYNPNSEDKQTFIISGEVKLPDGVTNTNNVSLEVTISVTVAAKMVVTVSKVEISTMPTKTIYTEGEVLDLTGLQIKLSYSDGNSKTVALADFADNSITTNPNNGETLAVSDTTITVSVEGKSTTFNITVNVMQTVETPTFSPEHGTYTGTQTVTLSSKTEGATIYYAINGTEPTTSSTEYTAPITVSSTMTIKAIAVKNGMKDSAVASATYTIQSPPPAGTTPSFTQHPSNHAVTENQTATFTVIATGDPAPTYQWQVNKGNAWEDITGATDASYITPATTANMNGWQYLCVATNDKGTVNSDVVTLTVSPITYVITATVEEGGSIDPVGEVTVESGKDQTFTITANSNYRINEILVDGKSVTVSSTYTFENVAKDHTIHVSFTYIGSSGPSTPPVGPPVKPPVEPEPEPVIPDENGNAEIKVDEKKAEELLEQAVNNDSKALEILKPEQITDDLTSVSLPKADLATISEKIAEHETINSVSIATSTGTIVVEQEVLAGILESTDAETVSFAVNDAKDKLTEEQKQAVGNNPVFEINIHADDQKVTSFNGKTITISLPYELKDGEDPNNIVIYHLKDDGTVEKMNGYYDEESKQFIFETNHLSMFFIAYEAAEPVTPDQPDDNKNDNTIYYILAAIVVIILIIALAYYFLQKKQ